MYEQMIASWYEIPDELSNIIDRACILVTPDEREITVFQSRGKNLVVDTTTKSGISDDSIEMDSAVPTGDLKINPELIKRVLTTMSHIAFGFSKDKRFIALSGCNGNFLHVIGAVDISG